MKRQRITVCVATYNQEETIEACLRSILDQEVDADVDVLVGDDASTDRTSLIIKELNLEYGVRLTHLRRETNHGPYNNMRDLILKAEGDFIARVDGDDYWLPGKLALQTEFLNANGDCTAVYSNALLENSSGVRIGFFNDVGDWVFGISELLSRGNFLCNSTVLFRVACKRAWSDVLTPQIDYRAHLWHARHGKLGHIGEPLAVYRVGSTQSMVRTTNSRVRDLYWEAIESVPRELVSRFAVAMGTADFLRRVFFKSLHTMDPRLVFSWARRVIDAAPLGIMLTMLLFCESVLRMSVKIALGYLMFPSTKKKILYYR
ncbi:glycosyltransferase [Lysobacter sp. HDW10]|uniref:glycosyltransferase n=1 Tax=Lysobacter sp. HDW10 TaxID=2714936 RepID=UPI00140E5E04|nr:glycosyltransferase [Lysobacter sp. HDW10]QIK80342.1 glycosyltransferase [Lysobacter sp. HDW10]